ncbi:hypothetical protein [Clostridium sp. HBUAS56017]|uniref:hypothetical protein n=1 Tax=Clostridium sp. HBUAS56017 TaxID=2571128 RepID=UPI00117749FE|nr:hypothetical protein [Clostridium sp. HBUAS56017]
MNIMNIKNKGKNKVTTLRKKIGDDKLVISLVLIAVGVVLCFVYRDKISAAIGSAVDSLTTKVNQVFTNAN